MEPSNEHLFEGLYAFVRSHLLIVNNVVLASSTVVGVLDFMAPKLSLWLPKLVYSCTAILALTMIASALSPAIAGRLRALAGRPKPSVAESLWRRPRWLLGIALLIVISVVGFASVAKADQGGLIVSAFPSTRSFQETLFSMQTDVTDIKSGVGQANEKLDKLAGVIDPSNGADRCADVECAISNGASPEAVRRLFAKGAKVPGTPVLDGALLLEAALALGNGRFEVLDLLAQKGIDRDLLLLPILSDPAKLSKQGKRVASEVENTANLGANPAMKFAADLSYGDKDLGAWNTIAGCLKRSSGGVALVELAGLLGDADLMAHLRSHGAKFPARPLTCSWQVAKKSGFARVEFDPATGKYAGVSAH